MATPIDYLKVYVEAIVNKIVFNTEAISEFEKQNAALEAELIVYKDAIAVLNRHRTNERGNYICL